MERATDRSMTGVIGMTLASGWIGAGLNRLTGRRHEMESPGALVWLVTPLASLIVSHLLRRNSAPSGWSPGLPGGSAHITSLADRYRAYAAGGGRSAGSAVDGRSESARGWALR